MPGMSKKRQHGGRRENAGRPREYDQGVRVTVLMPAELLSDIDRYATSEESSRNAAIVAILKEALWGALKSSPSRKSKDAS